MGYDLRFLETLSYRFPSIAKASTEIINLSAILQLPKGTEHFISDVHGEFEQFNHIIRNGSGAVKSKIEEEFGYELSASDKRDLATLIYYPKEKMKLEMDRGTEMYDWYRTNLLRLVRMVRRAAKKYSRSRLRKIIDPDFVYIIDEFLANNDVSDKDKYFDGIMEAIIKTGSVDNCIVAFATCIQRMAVNHLHVVGDIYDRGPGPHIIMETLMGLKGDVDIQWGNHDVVWIGAACGNPACIASVLRLSARYDNLDIIEEGYGINLVPLMRFALETYKDDPCEAFEVKYLHAHNTVDEALDKKMHKAVAVIQFKLEGQLIKRHPEYHMEDRLLLDKIDYEKGTVTVYGKEYPMKDLHFPTVDPADPYKLSFEEEQLMYQLQKLFLRRTKLQNHVRFLFSHGGLYLKSNGNLLFHGCIPLTDEGEFKEVEVCGQKYKGKALMDRLDGKLRHAFYATEGKEELSDIAYFLWASPDSPVFAKDKMTTFERYFIDDPETHKEKKNFYYSCYEREDVIRRIFDEFELDWENGHIINGHVPVKQGKGESPVKCGGKLLIIDGGFSKAYRKTTGIAGYTLISNSYGFKLVYHDPFTSTEEAIAHGSDIHSETFLVEETLKRQHILDTDKGDAIREQINELYALLEAYRNGDIRERI